MKKIDYGVCSAVSDELKYLREICDDLQTTTIKGVEYQLGTINGKSVAMVATGIGTSCAAAVTTCLAKDFDIKGLFYIGTAGSLISDLKNGDVVIANSAFQAHLSALIISNHTKM